MNLMSIVGGCALKNWLSWKSLADIRCEMYNHVHSTLTYIQYSYTKLHSKQTQGIKHLLSFQRNAYKRQMG